MSSALQELLARVRALPEAEKAAVEQDALAATAQDVWVPNVGPQTAAYFCEADETLYGGEAGGGKSDLLLGLARNAHRRSLVLRRVKSDVDDLADRLLELNGSNRGYNSQKHILRVGGRHIQLSGCEQERDKQRFKGKAHDLKAYDELADFLESQYLFINTWLRSTVPGQRCRIVGATNGPTTPEGQWIVRRWAAWLDPNHPKPAKSGELRWYATIDGVDTEVDGPGEIEVAGRKVRPMSRTFIRSRLTDNPDLAKDGEYARRLDALPEELRRVYRDGDFTVGIKDDDWQAIPTAWIEAAMQRHTPQPPKGLGMTAMAVDVAQGGADQTTLAYRYGGWFGEIDWKPGTETKDGNSIAAMVVRRRRDRCPVVVDVGGGWGGDAVIRLKDNGIDVVAHNGVVTSNARTNDGAKLKFFNKRAEAYWRFREALDPEQEGGSVVALPDDPLLKADLAAVRYKHGRLGLLMEEKALIKERIGRSPDRGDAVVMCLSEGERAVRRAQAMRRGSMPTYANRGYAHLKGGPR